MAKPTILYFGTPAFSVTILDALAQANYPIVGVVTSPDQPQGRNHAIMSSPVKQWALKYAITPFTPETFRNNSEIICLLGSLAPDLIVVYSYGKIIPDDVLRLTKRGTINVHPSLLPRYRGPSPVQAQILAGDSQTGVTLIEMTSEVDAGPIIVQEKVAMPQEATFDSLIQLLSATGARLLVDTLPSYVAGKITPTPQPESPTPYTQKITKASGFIPFEQLARTDRVLFERSVRAYYPWPGVWTTLDNKVLKFLPEAQAQLQGKAPTSVKQLVHGYPALRPALSSLFPLS